jgi:FMN phosphatase YigB (HAD superfamily)
LRSLDCPDLESLFEVIIVAGENDISPKPAPMPFSPVLERLGINPTDAIYVGDDWRIDICGAQEVGIQPVWLKPHSISLNWPLIETPVLIITILGPLLDLENIRLPQSPE